jgi:hypothetical protein
MNDGTETEETKGGVDAKYVQATFVGADAGISEQQQKELNKPYGGHQIKKVKKGPVFLDYITASDVITRLNNIFYSNWDFRIVDQFFDFDKGYVVVHGQMTINDVIKEQFGGSDIKFRKGTRNALDVGNDFKIAATDAMKKCASMFGVALHLYNPTEEGIIGDEEEPVVEIVDTTPAEPQQIESIKKLLARASKDETDLFKGIGAKSWDEVTLPVAIQLMTKQHNYWK